MKTIGYLIFTILLFVIIGCNVAPVEAPGLNGEDQKGQQYITPEWVSVAQEGIRFQFDASLASTVDFTLIPASEEYRMFHHPPYMQFSLNNPENAGSVG